MRSPDEEAHKLWLSFVEKAGLVVSPPALVKAQAIVSLNVLAEQRRFLELVEYRTRPTANAGDAAFAEPVALLPDFRAFTETMLEWRDTQLVDAPESLAVSLPAYQDELRPTLAVPDALDPTRWRLLVTVLPTFTALDRAPDRAEGWRASPQERFERLLRETGVAAGLLFNGTHIRLVYAPKGETSGHLTFDVGYMTQVSGRPILAGMLCLLDESFVFCRDKGQNLADALVESRRYQATVSTALAGQVLGALHELLRGVQSADRAANGRMLDSVIPEHPEHLYAGLVTVLMRLVFLLYAEDRELMPRDPVYAQHYSVVGLFDRLRADFAMHPDTMDQRFGAWAHLVSLFRLVHDGGHHAGLALPARNGDLFNPDSFPFLEGRPFGLHRVMGERFDPPKIADGVVWRVLSSLLVHDHERLSYRTLDVEQIGSVYEAIMGFGVERSSGPTLALKPKNVFVDLAKLLELPGDKRSAFLDTEAGCKLPPAAAGALAAAQTVDDVSTAIGNRASDYARTVLTPFTLYLQPGEERRRSGSHYTPRELTSPIVATTLRPVLAQLGPRPTPEQILSLKVCDPAMGSGAFLVEACRQLGEHLVDAWNVHGLLPTIPADEEPYLHARRMVAQRCLYGVDRNPMAASLAKLSLWLVTLAKDHSFTFLDHALKHGDSLVGYSRRQIFTFNANVSGSVVDEALYASLLPNLGKVKARREFIQRAEEGRDADVRDAFDAAELGLAEARFKGDLLVAAFFGGRKLKEREELRKEHSNIWDDAQKPGRPGLVERERGDDIVYRLRLGARGVVPFHWEIEFPEVFDRPNPGFDCFVGNPPFAGKNTLASGNAEAYLDWLKATHAESHGNADLVAHFFRRCFTLLRDGGAFGLIATNTIAQGDTRSTGLRWIRQNGGTIYAATRRKKWPGLAAVIVSLIHILKGRSAPARLDDQEVELITAFLFHQGADDSPVALAENAGRSFQGAIVLGMGFTFDDTATEATPISEMERLLAKYPRNAERVFPFIGYSEVATDPHHRPHRFAINFGEMSEVEARAWPDLMDILERKVRPKRATDNRESYRRWWWQYAEKRLELAVATSSLDRVLVAGSQASAHFAFAFLPTGWVYSSNLTVIAVTSNAGFAVIQCRFHETWSRFFMTTMKDDLVYTPTTCFEPFPFPPNWQSDPSLEAVGQAYYDFRAQLMVANNEGLTATYNRFHDPSERSPEIARLRELHAAMDRAVLDAYGWNDVPTVCEFILDHDDGDGDEPATPSRRRKPYRLRWPDAVRDDVLARLLDLNAKRAAAERAVTVIGQGAAPAPRSPRSPSATKVSAPKASASKSPAQPTAFPTAPGFGPLFATKRE